MGLGARSTMGAHALFAVLVVYALTGLWGCGAGASLHCAMRREISPCTCRREELGTGTIMVVCQRITSFEQIVHALADKFNPETKISLEVSYSQISDLNMHTFRELHMSITKLKLNFDDLRELNESSFSRMDLVDYFSLADNELMEMPRQVMKNLPHIKTFDLCRNKITKLTVEDFQDIQEVEHLVVADNLITKIERHALPKALKHIHLGLNQLTSLNGALRDLDDLEWIFINANRLKTIDNELPTKAKKITLIYAAHNELTSLPKDLKMMPSLESLYFYDNNLKSLDGVFQKSKKLVRIGLSFNKIGNLAEDEFLEADMLADLDIAYNQIKSLNGSLRTLRSLRYLNLTHNQLTEFSLQEIKGLKRLSVIDLSHNKIAHLTGDMENLVDVETRVLELRLEHNNLHNLGGALMGLHGLLRLNVSHNMLNQISPDDLIGLDELRLLDISHNQITTLEETSKTFLPALEELLAHHNNITLLNKDFHGLPSLCSADLSYNQIESVSHELVSKTRCNVNGVPSILKIYLQDNPVLCDNHLFELISTLERSNARVNGISTCPPAPQTVVPLRFAPALNDVVESEREDAPVPPLVVAAHVGGALEREPSYRARVAPAAVEPAPSATVQPASSNVVVKWPDEQRPGDTAAVAGAAAAAAIH